MGEGETLSPTPGRTVSGPAQPHTVRVEDHQLGLQEVLAVEDIDLNIAHMTQAQGVGQAGQPVHCLNEKVMLGSYFSGLAADLLSSSEDKLVLDLVGRVLHQREVEQGPGEEHDDHGVGDGQDKLGREFARGA